MINLEPKQELNDEWEQIKTAIVDAARDVIQTQSTPPRNDWWDAKYKKIIQEKNEARKKCLQLKTRISWNTYINKRNEAIKFAHKRRKNGSAIK